MRNKHGFTRAEIAIALAIGLVMGSLAVAAAANGRRISATAICASNIRALIQSMSVYAQQNNLAYPTTMPPAKRGVYENMIFAHNGAKAVKIGTAGALLMRYFPAPKKVAQAVHRASPSGCLWTLIATGQMTPQTFVCPTDPFLGPATWSSETGKKKNVTWYWDNFSRDTHGKVLPGGGESYSIADPWRGKRVAKYWSTNSGSGVPIASDIAPAADMHAKAGLKRDPNASKFVLGNNALFNTSNHNGVGQNVGFADDHVVFHSQPFCGQNGDNIFTWDGNAKANPATGGKVPTLGKVAKGPRNQSDVNKHIDTVMIPVRDAATGGT